MLILVHIATVSRKLANVSDNIDEPIEKFTRATEDQL